MRFDVLTLFPELVKAALGDSIPARAQEAGQIQVHCHDIRAFSTNKHHKVDDTPYGGGAGMVMSVEPVVLALDSLGDRPRRTILMSPSGRRFDHALARELADARIDLTLICGRYEGIDARAVSFVDESVSLGDFVISGGELAAAVVIDAVARLIPGVLGNSQSAREESLADGALEYPHYTRPREFRGMGVPDVLLSGNHLAIRQWRRQQSLLLTRERRPDLFTRLLLSPEDKKLLES